MPEGAVLITGGAGYIGSSIAYACADAGYRPVVIDDLSTGRRSHALDFPLYVGDVADTDLVRAALQDHGPVALIHCAGLIDVVESIAQPERYFRQNVGSLEALLTVLEDFPRLAFILSSSASVYGPGAAVPVRESDIAAPGSPYAQTKLAQERLLEAATVSGLVRGVALRYFNPVGADLLGRSGPSKHHSTAALARVLDAAETGEPFPVHGVHYSTRDGSPERDFIDVGDLAGAHVAAIEAAASGPLQVINLGTGRGTTVLELVAAVERVTGRRIRVEASAERPGDIPVSFADVSLARARLGFTARRTLDESIEAAWRWRRGRDDASEAVRG